MTKFKALFGIESEEIKKNCILLPLIPRGVLKQFKIKKLSRGKVYSSASTKEFSVIQTGLGAGLNGDAVLYLKDTLCENIFLFGSCGLVKEKEDLSLASLVSPVSCYSQESFTEMLLSRGKDPEIYYPDKELINKFSEFYAEKTALKVNCSTLASLKLEEDMVDLFDQRGINIVDMEASAVFSAARHVGLKAMAIFYVSDIIHSKPFYFDLDLNSKIKVFFSIRVAANLLCKFIKANLSA